MGERRTRARALEGAAVASFEDKPNLVLVPICSIAHCSYLLLLPDPPATESASLSSSAGLAGTDAAATGTGCMRSTVQVTTGTPGHKTQSVSPLSLRFLAQDRQYQCLRGTTRMSTARSQQLRRPTVLSSSTARPLSHTSRTRTHLHMRAIAYGPPVANIVANSSQQIGPAPFQNTAAPSAARTRWLRSTIERRGASTLQRAASHSGVPCAPIGAARIASPTACKRFARNGRRCRSRRRPFTQRAARHAQSVTSRSVASSRT
jgi:hypothetical protein